MEQPGEGHGHGVVGEEERVWPLWWGPLVLILLAVPLMVADLLTDENHPADIWIANIKVLLIIAAAVWTALVSIYQRDKKWLLPAGPVVQSPSWSNPAKGAATG